MTDHQLHMARYIVHKMRVKQYRDAMTRDGMPAEVAAQRYRLAMFNYDSLMKDATAGSFTEADELDMSAGFPYKEEETL